jgi:putative membrane protein
LEEAGPRSHRRIRILGALAFAAGAGLVSFLLIYIGWAAITEALARFGFVGLAVVVIAHLPIVMLLGVAWWLVGSAAGKTGAIGFIWARAVRDAAAEALPFSQVGGYVIGARALVLSGVDAARAGISTLLDLTLEFAAKIPYIVLGFAFLAWLKPKYSAVGIGAGGTISVVGLILAGWIAKSSAPENAIRWLLDRFQALSEIRGRIATLLRELTSHRKNVWRSLLLHFVCWVLGAGELWLIFHFMHVPGGLGAALVIDSVVGGIRAVSFFVPGAIGVQEGSYVLFCGLFGISPGAALAISLARRARDLVIAFPVLLAWQGREGVALFRVRFKS